MLEGYYSLYTFIDFKWNNCTDNRDIQGDKEKGERKKGKKHRVFM